MSGPGASTCTASGTANFAASSIVSTLWQRYCKYRKEKEPLTSMGYFCLTVLEGDAGGRSDAATGCKPRQQSLESGDKTSRKTRCDMAIPDFDGEGLLPPGVYDCTLEEIGERFGRFQRSDCRPVLFGKLRTFIGELQSSGLAREVIVNGSFTTAEEDPRDIDMVVVLRPDHDFAAQLPPFAYNVL